MALFELAGPTPPGNLRKLVLADLRHYHTINTVIMPELLNIPLAVLAFALVFPVTMIATINR